MESPTPNLTAKVSWDQARLSNCQCHSKHYNGRPELPKSGFLVSPNGQESTRPRQGCLGESCTRDRNVNYTEPGVWRLRLNLLVTQQRGGRSDFNISFALRDLTVPLPQWGNLLIWGRLSVGRTPTHPWYFLGWYLVASSGWIKIRIFFFPRI